MKNDYINCEVCNKEVIAVVAKKRKRRCHKCWMEYQQNKTEKKYPYYPLRNEQDLLNAAYKTSPWLLRWLGISLPEFITKKILDARYFQFSESLQPGDQILPFHFNQNSLAMRKGILVIRRGKPHKVWITALS